MKCDVDVRERCNKKPKRAFTKYRNKRNKRLKSKGKLNCKRMGRLCDGNKCEEYKSCHSQIKKNREDWWRAFREGDKNRMKSFLR